MPCIARNTSGLEPQVFFESLDFLLLFDQAKSKRIMKKFQKRQKICLKIQKARIME